MKVLVTGATGFVGSHLVDALLARGDQVWTLQRTASDRQRQNLTVVVGDILDRSSVHEAVAAVAPDEVYHLAAQSQPQLSWTEPALTFQVNVTGTLNLLDAVRDAGTATRTVVACSSAEYRSVDGQQTIDESEPLEPSSPYGASKVACDHLARLYSRRYGSNVVRVRPFFLIGTRKTGDVSSDWAKRIVQIERQHEGELKVGNLEMVRDFLDVRDGVSALMTVSAQGSAGEAYNICSGEGWRLSDFLQLFLDRTTARVTVRPGASMLRPLDEPIRVGSNHKLKSLGWSQEHEIPSAVGGLLDYWREHLATGIADQPT